MKLTLKTKVSQDINSVFAGFNLELFEKLTPPMTQVKVLRFDGCKKGDIVSLELRIMWLIRQEWTSEVTASEATDALIYFIDEGEGKKLPFFLSKWRHEHRIERDETGDGAYIVDKIDYRAPFGLNFLLWPVLWLQFAFRRPVYRRVFAAKS